MKEKKKEKSDFFNYEMKEEKLVKAEMINPEGRMELKVKGKNAVENSLKIMKAFDQACEEIRQEEQKKNGKKI